MIGIKKLQLALAMSLLLATGSHAENPSGFRLNFTKENNCLVQVTEPKKLLLLPIEESMPEATVQVLANGRTEQTIYVRLAINHIDYFVPFDLTPYDGQQVTLDIRTQNNGSHSRNIKDEICWKEIALSDTFDTPNREPYRPLYHHTPLYGWMNDPNGMFYKDGKWHLYYQYNPYGSLWQNMHWGHSVSEDLVHWEHCPLAIAPNGFGSVFSGSAVVDKANTAGFGKDAVIALYTSAGFCQIQSLAWSDDDGTRFNIYEGNPVIAYERESRDPNMFWDEKSGKWVLILASALDHEMLIFSSTDLKEWNLESHFGQGFGSQDGVWECPDLMELPIRGTDRKKWVLVCNINPGGPFGGSGTQYFVGNFDGKQFKCDTKPEVTKWMDYGKDHYATVSWSNAPDNRHTVIAWMSNWQYANDVPTRQFRSANSLPRELELFRAPDGELYLAVTPSPEVESLRDTPASYKAANISAEPGRNFKLPAENDGICEIVLDLDARKAKQINIVLSNDKGEKVTMTYRTDAQTFSMDRNASGKTDFSSAFPAVTTAPLHNRTGKYTLRLFIDRSSIEAFDGEGRFAMTNLVFPSSPYTDLTISADGKPARMKSLKIYPLNPNKK